MVTYRWPFSTDLISDEFGWRIHPITGVRTHHNGDDFGVSGGTPIPSAADGTVVWSGANGGEGNSVHVRHPDGGLTKYFHMVRTNVNRGEAVSQGDTLGWVGTSGASTGNHLHFETWGDGVVQDPRVFMREHGADDIEPAQAERPVVVTKQETDNMRFFRDVDTNSYWLFLDNGSVGYVNDPGLVTLVDRFVNKTGHQEFYRSELTLIWDTINAIRTGKNTTVPKA